MLNFYLYSISAISLSVFYFSALVAVGGLLRLLIGAPVSDPYTAQETLSRGAGFAMLALPLWWVHWRWLRSQFFKASGYALAWHRFYLFTIICLTAIAMLLAGGVGLSGVLELTLSGSLGASEMENTGVYLATLLLSGALWLHHWRQFRGGLGELNPQPIPVQETAAS
jgi:hypothetical protein